ncbi:Protein [Escherichia coli]
MKIGTVAGTNDSTTTIATNDMVQEHVTNFTKELFGGNAANLLI